LRFHWRYWIEEFGSPSYYSTMHWESKHKQLKLIKEHRSNNHHHYFDLLEKDMRKSIHHIVHFQYPILEEVFINLLINILFLYFIYYIL
jgi:hypothetical protein